MLLAALVLAMGTLAPASAGAYQAECEEWWECDAAPPGGDDGTGDNGSDDGGGGDSGWGDSGDTGTSGDPGTGWPGDDGSSSDNPCVTWTCSDDSEGSSDQGDVEGDSGYDWGDSGDDGSSAEDQADDTPTTPEEERAAQDQAEREEKEIADQEYKELEKQARLDGEEKKRVSEEEREKFYALAARCTELFDGWQDEADAGNESLSNSIKRQYESCDAQMQADMIRLGLPNPLPGGVVIGPITVTPVQPPPAPPAEEPSDQPTPRTQGEPGHR